MDYKEIINLMREMNKTNLTKLEIEDNGVKICIEKEVPAISGAQQAVPGPAFVSGYAPIPAQALQPQLVNQTVVAAAPAGTAEDGEGKLQEEAGTKKLVSPMVGTFYSAASPDKPPFAKVGDKVKKGQTICIIEAMKLMNEIESEYDGEIVKILVNNEDMVEFGQPMFLIK
ncbi:MAG TPA: acetyl-CoA carboxylase biotin carboxyl carrier protein [Clostridiales bacterium]|nr:acetyl-CoA carboxylase biotin carboxyl carrier protein [Clostridiales bacterium]